MKSEEHKPQQGNPIGIWIRVSTEDQAQGDSPAHHEARARHYAAAKGWVVKEIYDLAGVSGKSVMEHPEAKRMLADVRRGHISALVFSKLARLTRNARELMDFSDIFRENNTDLVSLQENLDTSTPSGRLFFNMVSIMAQWEREEITDRVKASVAIRAKLHKPLGGAIPFGYIRKDNKFEPHPEEAPVRKLIFELFAEHRRKKTVARILNDRGFRTRNGSKFSDTTVERLVRDPIAKGIHRTNYTRSTGAGKAWALKPEHDWVMHEVPAIVSPELWDQCNALLEERRVTRKPPGKRPVHLFAGIVFCECGHKMYVPSSTPKYVCQKCHNRIPVVDLEAIFLEELKGYLLDPDRVSEYLKQAHSTIDEKAQIVGTLTKEFERVKSEADKVYRLYIEDKISPDQFKEQNQPLYERRKQIEAEIPKAEADLALLKIDGLSSEYIMEEARDVHACWPKMNTDERRRIVETLAKRITISKDEIDISLCYLPSFREITNRQRMVMDALPFCKATLTGIRCPHGPHFTRVKGYPLNPKTLGEAIRKRRLDLGLQQGEIAKMIGCDKMTVVNWEKGYTTPRINFMAGVIQFLGYDPFPTGESLSEQLSNFRKSHGLTQVKFARKIGVDPNTICRWERGEREPKGSYLAAILTHFPAFCRNVNPQETSTKSTIL